MRLPWRDDLARAFVRQLMQELTSYPRTKTTDLLIAAWLGESRIRDVLSRATQGGGHVLPTVRSESHAPRSYVIAT